MPVATEKAPTAPQRGAAQRPAGQGWLSRPVARWSSRCAPSRPGFAQTIWYSPWMRSPEKTKDAKPVDGRQSDMQQERHHVEATALRGSLYFLCDQAPTNRETVRRKRRLP